jgi:hypothetical protein
MTAADPSDEPVQLSPETAARLDALFERRLATRSEIVATLAQDAGYGELSSLASQTRRALEETVDEACNEWRVSPEPAREAAAGPIAPHQRLLRHYHALGSAILEIQDAALREALDRGRSPHD